ncbi:MAG: replication-associated recombination protein A [Actinomycetia bacterium]|nr:replication-associated recombination protein A [Actinomycetes bacterium]
MRPASIDEVVGQEQLLTPNSPLRALLTGAGSQTSVILWGPPGTGKTTLARVIANSVAAEFVELSAVSATVKDVRAVIASAQLRKETVQGATVLFIDEVHRFSKTQQDALLPAVENGWVTLVGATTENPSFAVIPALLSRSLVLPLKSLSDAEIGRIVDRALAEDQGLAQQVSLAPDAREHLIRLAGGDARRALTILGAVAGNAPKADPSAGPFDEPSRAAGSVGLADVEAAALTAAPRYDRAGDRHYDVTSALIKSVRGSDVDAALHYLAIMVVAGEDPRFIARRLMILASEDIGMADPSALTVATSAHTAVSTIGLPEARIILAQAVIHLALAPKSNAAYQAIDAAIADVRAGRTGSVPDHLRDGSTKSARDAGAAHGYLYPHDLPTGIGPQQYAPDPVVGRRYYQPTLRGAEQRAAEALRKIRAILEQPES